MNRPADAEFTRALFLAALACAILNFVAFYPGILHHDAWAYFSQARDGRLNNWQPPLLGYLWIPLQAIHYGPQPMLALFVAAYWSGFVLFARAYAPEGRAVAGWTLAAGLFPMALNFSGVLVKDIAMSDCLLAGGGIAVALTQGTLKPRAVTIFLMWLFLIASGFIRANALFALPPLIDLALAAASHRYAMMPWIRRAILCCALALLFIPGNMIADNYIYRLYEHLSPIAPLEIFDIGGISYFSGKDYFQGELGAGFAEKNRACYTPRMWDVYGWLGCKGSYDTLKPKFGAPLTKLWLNAIVSEPIAYLRHRAGHINRFLQFLCTNCREPVFTGEQSTNQHEFTFTPNPFYRAIDRASEFLNVSPLGPPYVWLLICLTWSLAAFGIPNPVTRRVTLMIALSGAMYAGAFAVVGIASDYRYIDWTMLCALLATPVIFARVVFRQDAPALFRFAPLILILGTMVFREAAVRFFL